jgi:hypothetical protein
MKVAGKLISERVCRLETTPQGKILADLRKFATCGDLGKKPLKKSRLGSEASQPR